MGEARVRTWPLYVGGVLGPYAGTMVTPMLHEVGAGLGATPGAVAGTLTAYMVPFAALMLVSGTLAERCGRERTMRWSLAVFAVASAACAFVPDLGWLLAARAAQGCANAFTTPLLLATITDLVPRDRLGRAFGVFAGLQAAGQAASPLLSGLAATVDWRLAFVIPTALAVLLGATVPRMDAATPGGTRGSWRALATPQLALACAVSFLCYLAGVALTLLAVLRADDDFGLGPGARGLLGAAFGVAGLVAGPLLGRRLETAGPIVTGVALSGTLAGGLVLAGLGGSVALLGAGIAVVGLAVTGLRTTVNSLSTTSAPTNRAGAASVGLSFQFFGGALAPIVAVPAYAVWGGPALAAAAVVPLAAGALLVVGRGALRR